MNFKDKEFVAAYMWYLIGRINGSYHQEPQDPYTDQDPKRLWKDFVLEAHQNGIDILIPEFALQRGQGAWDANPAALKKYIDGDHSVYHSSYCGWLNPYDTDYPE